jgi:hypothetical protein
LKLALRYIDEPIAITFLQEVITDIEKRLTQVAAARAPRRRRAIKRLSRGNRPDAGWGGSGYMEAVGLPVGLSS